MFCISEPAGRFSISSMFRSASIVVSCSNVQKVHPIKNTCTFMDNRPIYATLAVAQQIYTDITMYIDDDDNTCQLSSAL